jgi:hypothetical protein
MAGLMRETAANELIFIFRRERASVRWQGGMSAAAAAAAPASAAVTSSESRAETKHAEEDAKVIQTFPPA